MKNLFLLLIAALFTLILVLSTSNNWMKEITTARFSKKSVFGSDKYKYGDFFGMSFLSDFKIKNNYDTTSVEIIKYNKPRNCNLYVAGDSYTGISFVRSDTLFCGVKKYYHIRHNFNETMDVKLVKSEKNILLIETVERNLTRFKDTNYIISKMRMKVPKEKKTKMTILGFFNQIGNTIYNPLINQNLEFNLFDYPFFTPFKEMKANFNYRFFNRLSNEVVVAPDKKYLLLKSTVDTINVAESSLAPLSDDDINLIVDNINYLSNYYKLKGFDEVYISIIPNPVTVLYPQLGKYNEAIPRIQNNKNLKVPFIDVFDEFKESKKQIFFFSDSHWNMNGFYLWVNEFNKKLNERYN